MESQISPKNIETRVEAMATEEAAKTAAAAAEPAKPAEPVVPAKPAEPVKPAEPAKPAEPVKPEAAKPAEPVKPVEKPIEKKQPNDPTELRKWSTKLSQENAELRNEMKSLKVAIEKMSKKPVDYTELAKNPDSLKAHIEAERREAIAELQQQLNEKNELAVKNETVVERMRREQDKENYPRWEKLFPLIQTLAANSDARVNWNQKPGLVLDEAYAVADQVMPVDAPAPAPVPAPAAAAPVIPGVTEEQVQARIAAAVAEAVTKAKADSEAGIRAEQNGAGIGGLGKGGRRDLQVNKDALKKMPLKDLKGLIQKE